MNRKFKKKIEATLATYIIYTLRILFLRFSTPQIEKIGQNLGHLIYFLSKRYRKETRNTLKTALPELSENQTKILSKKTFRHFGAVALDLLTLSRLTLQELEKSVEIQGIEHLDNALKKQKGVLALTGHFGNWERIGALITSRGYPINVVVREIDQPKITQLFKTIRGKFGIKFIYKGKALSLVLKKLAQNEIVVIMADQNAGEPFLPFFNKPCGTIIGPALIHTRTQCTVITAWCKHIAVNRYLLIIEPAIENHLESEKPAEKLMEIYNQRLENQIRSSPEQWLWLHDRWKYARLKGMID